MRFFTLVVGLTSGFVYWSSDWAGGGVAVFHKFVACCILLVGGYRFGLATKSARWMTALLFVGPSVSLQLLSYQMSVNAGGGIPGSFLEGAVTIAAAGLVGLLIGFAVAAERRQDEADRNDQ